MLMPMSVLAAYDPAQADLQEMPCHSDDGGQADQGSSSVCADMKGCCSGFLPPIATRAPALLAPSQSVLAVEHPRSGFVPEHVDPPPVSL